MDEEAGYQIQRSGSCSEEQHYRDRGVTWNRHNNLIYLCEGWQECDDRNWPDKPSTQNDSDLDIKKGSK